MPVPTCQTLRKVAESKCVSSNSEWGHSPDIHHNRPYQDRIPHLSHHLQVKTFVSFSEPCAIFVPSGTSSIDPQAFVWCTFSPNRMDPFGGTPRCPRCEKLVYAAEQTMGPGRKVIEQCILSMRPRLTTGLVTPPELPDVPQALSDL